MCKKPKMEYLCDKKGKVLYDCMCVSSPFLYIDGRLVALGFSFLLSISDIEMPIPPSPC